MAKPGQRQCADKKLLDDAIDLFRKLKYNNET